MIVQNAISSCINHNTFDCAKCNVQITRPLVLVLTRAYMLTHRRVRICACTQVHGLVLVHTHPHIHAHACIYTHIRTYTYRHTLAHTYARTPNPDFPVFGPSLKNLSLKIPLESILRSVGNEAAVSTERKPLGREILHLGTVLSFLQ